MNVFKKNTPRKRLIEPAECYACHGMIEAGKVAIRHHLSYYPEKTVLVHGSCHIRIHNKSSKFPDLVPDPRQVQRWYRNKGVPFFISQTYASEWKWLNFINSVQYGFLTKEMIEKYRKQSVFHYWNEISKIMNTNNYKRY